MADKHGNRDITKCESLEALHKYCEFRKLNPDQLIQEVINARRSEDLHERRKPERMMRDWYSFLTDDDRKHQWHAVKLLSSVKPFFKSNGCELNMTLTQPKAPARESNFRVTQEFTRKMIDEARKLQTKFGFGVMAQTGLRPNTVCQLRYRHVKESLEKDKSPLMLYIPGKITKTGQPFYSFILDDTKEILRALIEQKKRKSDFNDDSFLISMKPNRLSHVGDEIAMRLGTNPVVGLKPFTTGSWREYVQNMLEGAQVPSNRVSLLMGANPKGRDAHYTNPPPEVLKAEFMKAVSKLIIYPQFMIPTKGVALPAEQVGKIFEDALAKVVAADPRLAGRALDLGTLRRHFQESLAKGLDEGEE